MSVSVRKRRSRGYRRRAGKRLTRAAASALGCGPDGRHRGWMHITGHNYSRIINEPPFPGGEPFRIPGYPDMRLLDYTRVVCTACGEVLDDTNGGPHPDAPCNDCAVLERPSESLPHSGHYITGAAPGACSGCGRNWEEGLTFTEPHQDASAAAFAAFIATPPKKVPAGTRIRRRHPDRTAYWETAE